MNQALDSQEDDNKRGEPGAPGSRESFRQAFKRRLFQIYFELMRERNTDLIFAAVLMAINFIQLYGLLYNTKINFPFNDDLYSTICSICDVIRIYPLLEGSGMGMGYSLYYYVVAFALIVILVLYFLLLLYVDYSFQIEKFYFTLPVVLLRIFSSLFFWVFLMPITEIFVAIFSCQQLPGGSSATYNYIDTSLQCWSGMHIFYCALFGVALFGYCIAFGLISFFYNESRPYHTDALARLDTNFETLLTTYKLFVTIIGHFCYTPNLQWLIIVIHIIGALYFCNMYLKYLPYYNSRASVIFGAGWFIYLWLAINVLLLQALQSTTYQGQSWVIVIGAILIFPATHQFREMKIEKKIFTKKHDKIRSEFEIDLFIHKLYRLIIDQHVNEVDEMILLGIVHNHQSECLNSECPLNNQEELYLPISDSTSDRRSVFSKDPILLYHLINSIYAEYAKSSNSTAVLHTTYAYFLFYQIGNIHTALLELNVAEKCDTNFQQKFTVYRAKRFIENFLIQKYSGRGNQNTGGKQEVGEGRSFAQLDVTIVITFEGLAAKLQKEIEKSANDHIEFWSHLDSQMRDLNVLHKLGLNIINNTKRINELWAQLTRINPNYPKALQIYGNYLIQIKNDTSEGEEYINRAMQMQRPKSVAEGEGQVQANGHQQQQNDFEMMFAEDTAIVIISGNKESQAKIMKTNNGITKLFGYNTFEVHGHEVNILMPPIIGVKHSYILDQFFKTGKQRITNSELPSFAMLRVGHIFSISIIVKPVPSLKNDIQYIGLVKPTGKDYDYILTDPLGRIDSISKGISSMLGLQPAFFKENEIFIQVICPQLCEVERVKGSKEYATKFDQWSGLRDLSYIIPKNFNNLGQKSGTRTAGGAAAVAHNGKTRGAAEDEFEVGRNNEASGFVGLKSPDHLKKVCNMFKNQEHKSKPHEYMKVLQSCINYSQPDIYKGPIKTEIINREYARGYLQIKIFKILNPRKGAQGTSDDSDSNRGAQVNQGNKNVRAMIEETSRRMEELSIEELHKRIGLMQQALNNVKRGIRHPSARLKPSNIITPSNFEIAEINRYAAEIKEIQAKYKEKKEQEMLEEKSKEDSTPFPLLEAGRADYENKRANYPLSGNAFARRDSDPKKGISANDISAIQDDSMLDNKSQFDNSMNKEAAALMTEVAEELDDKPKAQFAEERPDLLKDMRFMQDQSKKGKPVAKKKKDGEPDAPAEGEAAGETPGAAAPTPGGDTPGGPTAEEKAEDEKFLEEDTGSVASSTKSIEKHLRMLRNALYENYVPPSINNLKINAKIVFASLLIITIVWYVYSQNIYSQLKDNIQNIHSSKNRINSLTNIGSDVRALFAMNQGWINGTTRSSYLGQDYTLIKRNSLFQDAQTIQEAQNNLSTTYLIDTFTTEDNELINPSQIQLVYNSPAALPMFYYVDIWSAVMISSVDALSIMNMTISNVTRNDTTVFFILANSLNNVLYSIYNGTQAILDESSNISNQVRNTLMILLIVASCSIFISLCLIFPVATKVDQNKDELLTHFTLIDRDNVKQQLVKCREFFNNLHDKENHTQQVDELEEEEAKEDENSAALADKEASGDEDKGTKKIRRQSKRGKNHKKYSTNFISLIVKFLLVVTILEGYFVLCFLESGTFLNVAKGLIQESGTITQRYFSNNFLYQIMQEMLTTNGTALVLNQNSIKFTFNFLTRIISNEEDFLSVHSNNAQYHSDSFNSFFNDLVYKSVCDTVFQPDSTGKCHTFMGGILDKGLYSSNVAYWDNMLSMATDFNNSVRDRAIITTIMNSNMLMQNEQLQNAYLQASYQSLLDQLDLSIFYNFTQRDNNDTILFSCYIVILFLLYFILWNKFMETTRHSLWVTKSMLAIIPLDIIQKVPKIRDFLLASSKTTFSAMAD